MHPPSTHDPPFSRLRRSPVGGPAGEPRLLIVTIRLTNIAKVLDQKTRNEVPAWESRVAALTAELRAREEQLADAQRLARLGSWEWDVRSNRVTWSDELFRIYGLEPGAVDVTFERYLERVHPEDRERVKGIIGGALDSGGSFEFEERIIRPDGEVRVLASRGIVVRGADGQPMRMLGSCQDVTERADNSARDRDLARERELRQRAEEQEKRAAFMADAATILSSSLDYEATLRRLAALAVPRVADWCAVDVLDEMGETQRLVVAHPDPKKEELARELHRRYPPDPNSPSGVPRVLRTGEPELIPFIAPELIESIPDEEQRSIIRELRLTSIMTVPLIAGGRVHGAITLVSAESGGRFDDEDLRFAQDLAARAALAIENARLYREAQRAREDLERQNYITRTVTENATAALFMTDSHGRPNYMNAAAREMTGYALEEIADITLHEAIHHHRPDGTPYPIEECPIDGPLPEDFSIRAHEDVFVRKDGRHFPGVFAASPIFGPSRQAVGRVVEVRDLTEERAAQAAIRLRDQQFRFLADSIPVQVWTAAPDGQLDYVNEQVVRYFGEPAERVIGDGWIDKLPADQVDGVVERWKNSLQSGEPYEIEFLLRNGAGEYRWHLARARAQRDERGRVLRWYGSNTDIHAAKVAEAERERMTRELSAERARLLEVFEQAPAFICTLSGPSHVFESANPLYMRLVGRDDIVGKPAAEALPDIVGQGFIDLLDRVYTTGEAYLGTELPIMLQRTPREAAEEVLVNFLYEPMRDAAGVVYGIFVHGVDVTDQVRQRREVEAKAEELTRVARQLKISNEELDQFAYVASHDLKAPLRGIANLSQWIEEDLAGAATDEVREHLDRLRGRIVRMEGLIDGILQFSRAGRVRDTPERVDVGALVGEVIELIAPPHEITFDLQEAFPVLTTERLPLQQVLMNLIGNAVKFAPKDGSGHVKVGFVEEPHWYRFHVADNGPGIPEEYQERIFGIFQTLQPRDEVEGTGIGLSLVKKIVETRGGRVWVESKPGEGATFYFSWSRDR